MTWTAIFTVSAAIFCLLCALSALLNAISVNHDLGSSVRRARSNAAQIESLQISLDSLQTEVLRLANSKKMTDVRNATEHVKPSTKRPSVISSEPDAATDPEAWRAWMNAQLRINPRQNQ